MIGVIRRRQSDSIDPTYLQVIDVLLCVQVNATTALFDGHDGEAHVDAAVELPFLDLYNERLIRN